MSLSKPVDFTTGSMGKSNHTPIEPPIVLIWADNATLCKGQYHTYELCANLLSATSSTYKLDIPLFFNRMVEEWLHFCNNLGRVAHGQNATRATAKCALARHLLESEALTTFNNQATTGTETNKAFEECLDKVRNLIFPKQASQLQKVHVP